MTSTMKRATGLLAVLAAAILALAMAATAWAAEPSTPSITINTTSETGEAATDTTAYTWYRIMEAAIDEDPTGAPNQQGGKVSYYVDSEAKANALTGTGLFTVDRAGTTNKWYVELKDENTSGQNIADAFAASTFNLSLFETGTFAQTTVAGSISSGDVAPGYYYITSTAGTKAVVQTLTKVEINEKNIFPTIEKAVDEDDANAQIGDAIGFTLTVKVPETANDTIVITDTMDTGLTFDRITTVKAGSEDFNDYSKTSGNPFTITIAADKVKEIAGKTLVIEYVAVLNSSALINTNIDNNVVLDYGEHYTTVVKTASTKTYSFTFDKVDGSDESQKLPGAVFQLKRGASVVKLIQVEAGKVYRVAMTDETGAIDSITTTGETITINGLDTDVTNYTLVENDPPTGYNKLNDPIPVTVSEGAFEHQNVQNNKGTVLPSTGGIGTTIFYVIGGILIAVAAIFLITRKRVANARKEDEEI